MACCVTFASINSNATYINVAYLSKWVPWYKWTFVLFPKNCVVLY